LDQVRIDPAVFTFTAGLCLLTGILFGLVPAWKVSGRQPKESLQVGGRGLGSGLTIRRTYSLLVISECALAVVLLAGAGLLIRTLMRVQAVDPGFHTDHVLVARVVQSSTVPESHWAEFYLRALERIRSIPGVEAAGAIDNLFFQSNPDDTVIPEERAGTPWSTQAEQVMGDGVSADYFRVLGVTLLRGRFFSEQDSANSARVAIINRTLARRFWPGQDSIGKRFRFGFQKPSDPAISVIGVVGDMRREGLTREAVSQVFLPLTQDPARGMDLLIRAGSDPLKLAGAVRSAVGSVDRSVPLFNVATLSEQLSVQTAPVRFETYLLGILGAFAMLLATVGIYGIMRYSVAQRTHEIGVRVALGAKRTDVLRLVLGQAIRLTATGVGAGILTALALTRFLSSLLYGVRPTDLTTYLIVSLMLSAAALVACYLPARRAAHVDPMMALRRE
jgi:predicted permease